MKKLYNFVLINKDNTINTSYKDITFAQCEKYINIYWSNTILKNICSYKIMEGN